MESVKSIFSTRMHLFLLVSIVFFGIAPYAVASVAGMVLGSVLFEKVQRKLDEAVELARADAPEPDDEHEDDEELDEKEAAALRNEIEDLKKRLEQANLLIRASNRTNSEMKMENRKLEKELKQVKEEYKRSQEDLEYELEDIVRDLMRQAEQKKQAFEEAVEEAKFDRLDEFEADTSFEMVDDVQE